MIFTFDLPVVNTLHMRKSKNMKGQIKSPIFCGANDAVEHYGKRN